MVRPERKTEHVGDDLVSEALRTELPDEVDENLIRGVRERRSAPGSGRQGGDQHRRLPHDRVDEYVDVHDAHPSPPAVISIVPISARADAADFSASRARSGHARLFSP